MIRVLPVLIVLGAILGVFFWTVNLGREGRRSLPAAPDAVGGSDALLQDQALLVDGPEHGPGVLHLTPTQVVFVAGNGRVLVIERLDITGATTTRELPGRGVASPVLVISTEREVYYFLLDRPQRWVAALT